MTAGPELIPALPEQMLVLDNLLQLYAHDFSEFHAVEMDEVGRFQYHQLPLYWQEAGRHPFLIRVDGQWAGFVLVKQDAGVWDVAEFFVLRRFRRRKIGMLVAHLVWRRFAGPWTVRVMVANHTAVRFWARALAQFMGREVAPERMDGEWWRFGFSTAEK